MQMAYEAGLLVGARLLEVAALDDGDVGGIDVALGNGDDGPLPDAVQRLVGPAVGDGEVFVYEISLVERVGRGKERMGCIRCHASQ